MSKGKQAASSGGGNQKKETKREKKLRLEAESEAREVRRVSFYGVPLYSIGPAEAPLRPTRRIAIPRTIKDFTHFTEFYVTLRRG